MSRALTYCIVVATFCIPCAGAPRHSWNRIRYEDGTLQAKVNPYDWNTTLTVNDDSIVLVFTPATVFSPGLTLRLKPSQIVSLSRDETAWRRVAEVTGKAVPARPGKLFGMIPDWGSLGIVYQGEDGKRGALLLRTPLGDAILKALTKVTGKAVEGAP